jgi:hypothetical protein
MKVFISWSGAQSRRVATAMHALIKDVLPGVQPWASSVEITSGQRWQDEVARHLMGAQYGIIVATPENLSAPWLLLEAGALSAAQFDGRCGGVCPYLVDLQIDLLPATHPLRAFQARTADHDGTLSLLQDINRLSPKPVRANVLLQRFFASWRDYADEALPEWEEWEDEPVSDLIEELTASMLAGQAASLVPMVRLSITLARVLKDESAAGELTKIQRVVMTTPMGDVPAVVFQRLQAVHTDLAARMQPLLAGQKP